MRFLKYLGIGLGVVVLGIVGVIAFISIKGPTRNPPSTEKVEVTPERLARGKYLVENVAACFNCHAERDWTKFGAPVVPGTEGGPGFCVTEDVGHFCGPNITPHPEAGIGAWTDGEIIRAIREGVSRDNRPLAAMMPFMEYRSMSDEDVRSVVAYLRSLPPIAKKAPPSKAGFPMSVISNLLPKPVEGPIETPARGTPAHGEYIANLAGCRNCHSSNPLSGDFIGGFVHSGPWGKVAAPNLTQDVETGIGALQREAFIGRFKAEIDTTLSAMPATMSPMPWIMFGGMSEADLGDLHDYLRTLKPVRNNVVRRAAANAVAAPAP